MNTSSTERGIGYIAARLALVVGLAVVLSVGFLTRPASAQMQHNQMGTSFDCSRTGPNVPSLVCQTPELRLADLLQMQPYYTLRHAQPERQQELRGQFTIRIQELVRECSTEQVRAGGTQSACVTRALGGLRTFWLQQIERIGNAAALDEARLPPGHFTGSQQALKDRNFLPAEAIVDGVFGSGSRQAIARFQAERGLPANGFLTAATADALRVPGNAPPPPAITQPSPAQFSAQMRFTAIPPQQPVFMFGNSWTIIAEGVIDLSAPARLRTLIRANNIPDRSHIYFNSPGGSVTAALELGRILREERIYANLSGYQRGDQPPRPSQPPICLSACALAFIGAPFRFGSFRGDETFGVHRFYSQGAEIGDDVTQVLANQIVQYIREMGVDIRLFAEIVRAGRNDINILSRAKLEELGVVNNGIGRTAWSLESVQDFIYLKGERETFRGINKFILQCNQRRWMLMVIFHPEGRWEEIREMGTHSLLIDGHPHPLFQPSPSTTRLVNGLVNIAHPIGRPMLERMARSRTVGFAAQNFHGAPVFLGFDDMEFEGGRERLSGLRRTCGD